MNANYLMEKFCDKEEYRRCSVVLVDLKSSDEMNEYDEKGRKLKIILGYIFILLILNISYLICKKESQTYFDLPLF
jgi:hypothetical protein